VRRASRLAFAGLRHALKAWSSFFVVYPPDAIRLGKVKAFQDRLFPEFAARR
jgi:LysR family glycine cleavage system transcriptional activator